MLPSSSDPRDNPVWHSLESDHAGFALRAGAAARYPADVAPFAAAASVDAGAADWLAAIVEPGDAVLIVGPAPPLPAADWSVDPVVYIAQMSCASRLAVADGPPITPLTSARHVADALALTARVYPHYFRRRTIEMGRYFGIYDGDTLAAMAGERMRFGVHQELSAICTHPDYTGRGYARRLTALLANDVLDGGRAPFLHVSHDNVRAKALYERLGFRHRADIALLAARRRLQGRSAVVAG